VNPTKFPRKHQKRVGKSVSPHISSPINLKAQAQQTAAASIPASHESSRALAEQTKVSSSISETAEGEPPCSGKSPKNFFLGKFRSAMKKVQVQQKASALSREQLQQAQSALFAALRTDPLERTPDDCSHMLRYFVLHSWLFFTKEPLRVATNICRRMLLYRAPSGSAVMEEGATTDRETGTRYLHFLLKGTITLSFTRDGVQVSGLQAQPVQTVF
jgi:hypothetical protein